LLTEATEMAVLMKMTVSSVVAFSPSIAVLDVRNRNLLFFTRDILNCDFVLDQPQKHVLQTRFCRCSGFLEHGLQWLGQSRCGCRYTDET